MRLKRFATSGVLALIPVLTGCLTHTHTVLKTREPDVVYTASLDHLLEQVDDRYKSIQTATLFVDMSASTGGSREGEVKQYPDFSGYIILQNPDHIRVILKVPLLGSVAMEMVSDGKSFKMIVPPENCAIVGSDTSLPTQKGLYSLRPEVILNSLLIPPLEPGQDVSMTQDMRPPVEAPKTKGQILTGRALHKDWIEEPDYDIEFLSQPKGQVADTLRVIHIGRSKLLPYQQDIYNAEGKIETQATYDAYQKFGDINFPTKIVIQRKSDDLKLTITVKNKTNFNRPFGSDEFVLDPIPATYSVQNMDDPASAQSNPCVSHPSTPATPSTSSAK